ncbi:unnamed protein product [Ilex paraguariensis]|uniref:Transmembrane 9 superfamily member n=1 Tax=Ilex paraguariensis TaxID=185542 RepID=A0ABC8TFQ5_9AQUA
MTSYGLAFPDLGLGLAFDFGGLILELVAHLMAPQFSGACLFYTVAPSLILFSLVSNVLNTSSDDLPLWGFVGELHPDRSSANKHVLYTHKKIVVRYNKDQIIHVNLTQESPKPLEVGRSLDLTYSVQWVTTNITFAHRFDVYLDYPFFEHQIHWFSIFNSFMMVIFLTGLVSMILMRTLRNDYAKYAREDDDLETLVTLVFLKRSYYV